MGLIGWTRVQRGRTFPLATQVSQCKPESQFLSATHVCPSCLRMSSSETGLSKRKAKKGYWEVLKLLLCTLRASEEGIRSKTAKRVVASVGFCEKEREESEVSVLEQRKKQSMHEEEGRKIYLHHHYLVLLMVWEERWDIVAFICQLQRLNAKFEFQRLQHVNKTYELNVNHFIAALPVKVLTNDLLLINIYMLKKNSTGTPFLY